ncbi:MAG: hypothetical protein AAF371_05550 [Pseudomonadota bacterium]
MSSRVPQRHVPRRRILALGLVAALPGCALFGGDEEEERAAEAERLERRREPVENVGRIEIGRASDGSFAVSAFGVAPTTGFSAPTLAIRRGGRPAADGFLEFDFLALAPDPGLQMPRGEITARRLRADRVLKPEELAVARGVRVYALRNASSFTF